MAQYGTGRKPHTCWRCKLLFEQELEDERENRTLKRNRKLPLFNEFYAIFREGGTSKVKDWIDERYAEQHKGHKKSWV